MVPAVESVVGALEEALVVSEEAAAMGVLLEAATKARVPTRPHLRPRPPAAVSQLEPLRAMSEVSGTFSCHLFSMPSCPD